MFFWIILFEGEHLTIFKGGLRWIKLYLAVGKGLMAMYDFLSREILIGELPFPVTATRA